MKPAVKKIFYLFYFTLTSIFITKGYAQNYSKDSIDVIINKKMEVIERVALLNNYADLLSDKNTNLATSYANQALVLSTQHKLQKEKGKALNNLAWIKYRKGDFTSAFEHSTLALKWNEQMNNLPELAASYRCMASVYNSQNDYKKAIEFFKKDLELHTKLSDKKSIGRALNNISYCFLKQKQNDSARYYNQKALDYNLRLNDNYLLAFSYRTLGDLYESNGMNDSARLYYSKSILSAEKVKSIQLQLTAQYRLGRNYSNERIFKEAIKNLERALALGIQMGAKSETSLIYNLLSIAYEGNGQFKEAYIAQKKFSSLNDSLYQERSRSKLAEMQAKFEAERKQTEINQLKKEKQQQHKESQQKTFLNISLMITTIVFIIMLMVIWRKNKYKTAINLLLNKQKEELEETLLLKDKVFSIVSHDLRSPIASLNAVLPMLDPDTLDKDSYQELKDKLTLQVQNLHYVLDNLLIWSRSRMKGISGNENTRFQLKKQADFSVNLLKTLAQQKEINILNQIAENLYYTADSQHFDIIIRNLLLNAIKFTPVKGIIALSSEEDNNNIRISVTDNGIGMTQDQVGRLFQLKTHFTTPGTQKEKGTGLGLLICAEYAAANNWNIQVKSEPGKGSQFSLILPKNS